MAIVRSSWTPDSFISRTRRRRLEVRFVKELLLWISHVLWCVDHVKFALINEDFPILTFLSLVFFSFAGEFLQGSFFISLECKRKCLLLVKLLWFRPRLLTTRGVPVVMGGVALGTHSWESPGSSLCFLPWPTLAFWCSTSQDFLGSSP